jgi:hypothetical protein
MARKKTASGSTTDESRAMEQRVVAFAEQLGRMVGTVERKATGWLDMASLSDQVTRIRDGAADLLSHLGGRDGGSRAEAIATVGSHPESPVPDNASQSVDGEVSRVRDRKPASPRPAKSRAVSTGGGSRDRVAAPLKAHRKPPPSVAGAKHSDEEIAKARASDRNRRTRGR